MEPRDHDHFWQYPGNNISSCHPPLRAKAVFRELIASELRAGKLTPWHRARIVRYAAQMGLSAVEAGRLIAECQNEIRANSHETHRELVLRLERQPSRSYPLSPRVAITTGILLLIIWLLR